MRTSNNKSARAQTDGYARATKVRANKKPAAQEQQLESTKKRQRIGLRTRSSRTNGAPYPMFSRCRGRSVRFATPRCQHRQSLMQTAPLGIVSWIGGFRSRRRAAPSTSAWTWPLQSEERFSSAIENSACRLFETAEMLFETDPRDRGACWSWRAAYRSAIRARIPWPRCTAFPAAPDQHARAESRAKDGQPQSARQHGSKGTSG